MKCPTYGSEIDDDWKEYRCKCGALLCARDEKALAAAIKRHKCKKERA